MFVWIGGRGGVKRKEEVRESESACKSRSRESFGDLGEGEVWRWDDLT